MNITADDRRAHLATAKAFIELPAEALPHVTPADDDDHNWAWMALRRAVRDLTPEEVYVPGDVSAEARWLRATTLVEVTLGADRDGWRGGVTISVPHP